MNNTSKTLRQWAITSGESEDKAIRHRARLGVGTRYGVSWVLTAEEWERVLASMRSARRGNPNWIKEKEKYYYRKTKSGFIGNTRQMEHKE